MESKKDSMEQGEIRESPELKNDNPEPSIKNNKADFENMVEFYLAFLIFIF